MKYNCSYTVVLDWMLDLGLNASELLTFATIYGFSQDGESAFTGSRAYLARKIAAKSKGTADNALNHLCDAGLVLKSERTINGVKFCEYRVDVDAVKAFINGPETAAEQPVETAAPVSEPEAPAVEEGHALPGSCHGRRVPAQEPGIHERLGYSLLRTEVAEQVRERYPDAAAQARVRP